MTPLTLYSILAFSATLAATKSINFELGNQKIFTAHQKSVLRPSYIVITSEVSLPHVADLAYVELWLATSGKNRDDVLAKTNEQMDYVKKLLKDLALVDAEASKATIDRWSASSVDIREQGDSFFGVSNSSKEGSAKITWFANGQVSAKFQQLDVRLSP